MTESLLDVVQPATGGDPMSATKYVRRSLRHLSADLAGLGHSACPTTIAALLRGQSYAPHVNVNRFTGPAHPDRDLQFGYVQEWIDRFTAAGWPILSVDTKKKELVGGCRRRLVASLGTTALSGSRHGAAAGRCGGQ